MNNCIFCKILNNELEGSFVFQSKLCSAFLDIHPVNEGHVLVVPKMHNERFTDIKAETISEMFLIAQKITKAIESSTIKCEGANIFLSDGALAGQEVPHSHLHIVPRFKNDGHQMGFSHADPESLDRFQLDKTAAIIKSALI